MTWTKLGDEFAVEARDLTDAEYRTHTEALIWSNWRLLDMMVPKRDLHRFAESPHAEAAVAGLVAKGWWQDHGRSWFVGVRFPEWQRDRAQVEHRRAYLSAAQRRSRKHKAGDHSECLPQSRCRQPSTVDSTVDPGRDGTGRETRTEGPVLAGAESAHLRPVGASRAAGGGTRNGATPSQSLRDHDGPNHSGPGVQQSSITAALQSPAPDRYARASGVPPDMSTPNGEAAP